MFHLVTVEGPLFFVAKKERCFDKLGTNGKRFA